MNNSKELPLHRVSSWQIYYNELNSSSFLLEPKWRLGGDINEVGSAPRENYVNDKSLLLKDVKKQNMSGGSVAVPSAYAVVNLYHLEAKFSTFLTPPTALSMLYGRNV